MKRAVLLWVLTVFFGVSYSQVRVVGNDSLKSVVTGSGKPYKLIYILCDYCSPSVERFPKLLEMLTGHEDVAWFPVCVQGSWEIAEYLEKNSFSETIYLINQNRKSRLITSTTPSSLRVKFWKSNWASPQKRWGFGLLPAEQRQQSHPSDRLGYAGQPVFRPAEGIPFPLRQLTGGGSIYYLPARLSQNSCDQCLTFV